MTTGDAPEVKDDKREEHDGQHPFDGVPAIESAVPSRKEKQYIEQRDLQDQAKNNLYPDVERQMDEKEESFHRALSTTG